MPAFVRAVQKWMRDVELPLLLGKTTFEETHVLYHIVSPDSGSGGGFADRMKGVVATFMMAVATKRAWSMTWDYPVELYSYLGWNEVPWPAIPRPDQSARKMRCVGKLLSCAFPLLDDKHITVEANLAWGQELLDNADFLKLLRTNYESRTRRLRPTSRGSPSRICTRACFGCCLPP